MSYFPRAARCLRGARTRLRAPSRLPTVADRCRAAGCSRERKPRHETRAEQTCSASGRAPSRPRGSASGAAARPCGRSRLKARLRDNKRVPQACGDPLRQELAQPLRLPSHLPGVGEVRAEGCEEVGAASRTGCPGAPAPASTVAAGKDECHRGVRLGARTAATPSCSTTGARRRLINGRVFELQPKACRNGTLRQLMFIHSEQNWNNTQCRNTKGDDGCRWEVPKVNDYRSYGCIKMDPERPQDADPALPPVLQGGGPLPDVGGQGARQGLSVVTRSAAACGCSSPSPRAPSAAG